LSIIETTKGNHPDHTPGLVTEKGGIGPFVTWVRRVRANGTPYLQTSRGFRKGLAPVISLLPDTGFVVPNRVTGQNRLRPLTRARLGWWIAVLFMIGSTCFAIAGMRTAWPGLLALDWMPVAAVNPVAFVGSLFFTSAAYMQFYEALNGDITTPNAPRRFLGWRPHNLGYLSSLVQFIGTLLFNRDTFDALISGLAWWEKDLFVWKPDIVGCVCFLVSSQLAIMEFAHGWFTFRPRQISWWIVTLNMLGSVLFMISGIAAFIDPKGELIAPFPANAGTFGGAVCFFLGACLLIPELSEKSG
jgi:hypothetical protein